MPDIVTYSSSTQLSSLFGKTRDAVLGLLILRPDECFHLRQIARLSGAGLGPVQRELAELVAMGIISREPSGRQVYFQARRDNPLFDHLYQLLLKTSGAVGVLRSVLAGFTNDILAAVIFGSVAKGQAQAGSDVDVLIITETLTMRDMGSAIRQASSMLGRDVNVNLYRPHEWRKRLREGHPLAVSIIESPFLMLIGDRGEFIAMEEQRLAQATHGQKK